MLNRLLKYSNFAKQITYSILLGLIITSCAQVVRPTGGKTDNNPPKALKFLPENKSLSFSQKSISILFDEFFTVKDINKQWIISPPLKRMPEYKIKGKLLVISFDDTLKNNTTYNFNFGKSIADVNEGNELLGLNYIFSTGTFIDSLQIKGNVYHAFNNKVEKDVLVMLYEEEKCNKDSFPYKITPDYFALSDVNGSYKLDYLKPGKYRAIALKDANNNYLFDSFEELIGFCDTMINLRANEIINFKLFKEIEEKTYLKNKQNTEYACFSLMFNKPLPNFEMKPLHKLKDKNWAIIDANKTNDTIQIYLQDFTIDTIKLELKNNNLAFDTVEFAVLPKEKFKSKSKRASLSKLFIKTTPNNGGEKDLNTPIKISFNHPIKSINLDSITMFQSKTTLPFKITKIDSAGKKYTIDAKLLSDSSYKISFFPGAFKDCFDTSNDTIHTTFKVPSIESVGNLFLSLSADSASKLISFNNNHILLQLLNEKSDLLSSQVIPNYGTYNFYNLKPGNYKMQLVIDENKNEKWDTGKWLKKQQAEKIIFMKSTINIRANWDVEEEWKISSTE